MVLCRGAIYRVPLVLPALLDQLGRTLLFPAQLVLRVLRVPQGLQVLTLLFPGPLDLLDRLVLLGRKALHPRWLALPDQLVRLALPVYLVLPDPQARLVLLVCLALPVRLAPLGIQAPLVRLALPALRVLLDLLGQLVLLVLMV